MGCNKPILGYRGTDGAIRFKRKDSLGQLAEVGCGRCIGCRLDRSREWAVRCMHEASLHEANSFVTLTFDDEHLPDGGSLPEHKFVFAPFMKRLRINAQRQFGARKIRFFMSGEYGDDFMRPHYHVLLFGFDFPDRYFWKRRRGKDYFRSSFLEQNWEFGYSDLSPEVTFKNAAYVARYIMKKITGDDAEEHYERIDYETGEVVRLRPEYCAMSRRPGIAKDWFERYSGDVFPDDFVVTAEGRKVRTPKYYNRLLAESDPEFYESVKQSRTKKMLEHKDERHWRRLEAKEKCAEARVSRLKREL